MLACLLPAGAYAAALGKLTVLSAIGQPLNAEIELLSVSPQEKQSLAVKLAPQQAFSQASVDYNPALGAMQFSIETRGAAQVVHITSAEGFNEPAVDVLLELSSANTPRAVREYSFLLDPPRAQGNLAQVKADPKPVPALADAKSDAKADSKADAKADSKADAKTDAKADAKAAPKADAKPDAKADAKADAKSAKKPAGKQAAKAADAKSKKAGKPSQYKIKQGDSLSAIANRMRPAGVSLDQMLVALYRANPDAFAGDNMSRMRAGAVLTVPDAETAKAIDRSDADSVVVAQAQDFQAYRQQLAGHVAHGAAKKGGAAAQSAGGKITAKVEERATPAAQAKDKLQLSKAGAGDGMTSEDKIAADKAAREAESRIKELEKNVGDLQKLLEIKNQNLAELSLKKDKADAAPAAASASSAASPAPTAPVAAAGKPGATPAAAAPAPAPAATPPAAETKPVAAAPETPATAPAAATTDAANTASTPAADAPADGATPPAASDAAANPAAPAADAPAKPKPVLSPPVPKPDFFDGWRENPMLLPGGGLLAVVLLAWAAYRARRNQKASPDDPAAADGVPPAPAPVAPVLEEPVVAPVVTPVEPEAAPEAAPAAVEDDVFVPPAEPVVEPVPEPVAETPPVADPLFATDETAAVAAAQAEAAEQQARRDAEEAIKIDLSRMQAPEPQVAPAAAPALDMSKLDFDLELDQNPSPPEAEDSALDIDLAAELAAQPPATPYKAPAAPELAAPSADQPAGLPPAIEGLSLDLSDADAPASAAETSASEPVAPGEAGADAAEEDEDETSSFAKEINTKLDLAAAYQEIGDKDGARELLDEVAKSGNRRQVAKAQEMLEQLS